MLLPHEVTGILITGLPQRNDGKTVGQPFLISWWSFSLWVVSVNMARPLPLLDYQFDFQVDAKVKVKWNEMLPVGFETLYFTANPSHTSWLSFFFLSFTVSLELNNDTTDRFVSEEHSLCLFMFQSALLIKLSIICTNQTVLYQLIHQAFYWAFFASSCAVSSEFCSWVCTDVHRAANLELKQRSVFQQKLSRPLWWRLKGRPPPF